jgi:hypothetical protein
VAAVFEFLRGHLDLLAYLSLRFRLCGAIRARFPNAKIVIGIWGANGEAPNMLERFARAGADSVATTVEQALDQLLGREQAVEKAKQEPLAPTSAA